MAQTQLPRWHARRGSAPSHDRASHPTRHSKTVGLGVALRSRAACRASGQQSRTPWTWTTDWALAHSHLSVCARKAGTTISAQASGHYTRFDCDMYRQQAHYQPAAQQLALQQSPSQQPPAQLEDPQAPSPKHRKLVTKFLTNDPSWLPRQQSAAIPAPYLSTAPSGAWPPGYQVAFV